MALAARIADESAHWGVDEIFIDGGVGVGGVVDSALIIWVAQVPQMPDRQPNTSASPTASASSSDVPLSRDHATVIADFANRTGTKPSRYARSERPRRV